MLTIKNHKFTDATVQQEPTNKYNGTIEPKFIVMHFTAGYATSGDLATLNGKNTKVSVHLLVSRAGNIIQMVPFNKRAWHAGPSRSEGYSDLNSHSIGIEITNIGSLKVIRDNVWADTNGYGHTFTQDGKFIGKDRKLECRVPISEWLEASHRNAGSGRLFWEPYPDDQMSAVEDIVKALLAKYPSIKWIKGHDDIDTRGWKTDPGPAFPMGRFQDLIQDRESGTVTLDPMGDTYIATVNLNARNEPNGPLINGVAPDGNYVTVRDIQGNWMLGTFEDAEEKTITGWMHSRYLERAEVS